MFVCYSNTLFIFIHFYKFIEMNKNKQSLKITKKNIFKILK